VARPQVVDYPNSTRAKKFFLTLMAGPPVEIPKAKDGSDDEMDEDAEGIQTGSRAQNKKKGKKHKENFDGSKGHPDSKGRNWVLKKKQLRRDRGHLGVQKDTKYTARKRKSKAIS
jgi:18S rRNA (guanine1575-N7)-methyltransferase